MESDGKCDRSRYTHEKSGIFHMIGGSRMAAGTPRGWYMTPMTPNAGWKSWIELNEGLHHDWLLCWTPDYVG